jgi:hypothetical protein
MSISGRADRLVAAPSLVIFVEVVTICRAQQKEVPIDQTFDCAAKPARIDKLTRRRSNGITTPSRRAASVICSEEVEVESTPYPATVGFSLRGRQLNGGLFLRFYLRRPAID